MHHALPMNSNLDRLNFMKKILIVGRPNVGKSSLINRLLGLKIAITAREEGVTRDIRYFDQEWNGKLFKICDSGGLVFSKQTSNPYQNKINEQIEYELNNAYKILFMVDFSYPEHPEDQRINQWLKNYRKKVILLINKVDNYERQSEISAFYSYGIEHVYPISAIQGNGIGDVLDHITENLTTEKKESEDEKIQIALIGKPNTGKSSLYNAIFNQKKALVDSKMGTTRDINQSSIKINNNILSFMDTAGLRKRKKITDTIEYFSTIRTEKAIEKANVIVFMVDAEELLTDQDKKILNHIFLKNKNCIVFVNKWDLTIRSDQARKDIIAMLRHQVPTLQHYPIIMGSAKEKHNIQPLLETALTVFKASRYRIPTGELNQFLERFFEINHPPSKKGKQFKIYYATQVSTTPPHFIFKVNDSNLLTKPFLRNFEREFRTFFPKSEGVGLNFQFKSKKHV